MKKLILLFMFISVTVLSQDITTKSLEQMNIDGKFAEVIAIDDSVLLNMNCIAIKLESYCRLNQFDKILDYPENTLSSQKNGVRYRLAALFAKEMYSEIVKYGLPKNINNPNDTLGPIDVCNVWYFRSLKAVGKSNVIANTEFEDVFIPNNIYSQEHFDTIVIDYLESFRVTKSDKYMSLYVFLNKYLLDNKYSNILITNDIFTKVLEKNLDINVMTAWIKQQSKLKVSKYNIPYYGFIFKFTNSSDIAKIKEAIQEVALSDVNDAVANAHLKLLQKLNFINN